MKKQKLTWQEIVDNDELLAKMWNRFIEDDREVSKEADDYGRKYMKVYPNTVEGIMEAYGYDALRFIRDNLSFWNDGESNGYRFCDKWCRINISSSEEQYLTSDSFVMNLIDLILMDLFGAMTKDSVGISQRFKQFCIDHQDAFKEENK